MTDWIDVIRGALGADRARRGARLQSLWSGYGEIVRVHLTGGDAPPTVILKHVAPPDERRHPRGWSGDRGHQRKLRSYDVELAFYRAFAPHCDARCRVPRLYTGDRRAGEWCFALEDLDAAGFPARRADLEPDAVAACLAWLAAFHAAFVGAPPDGLWPVGTYWHLATRPDELRAMGDARLRQAAAAIDRALGDATHQTLVHGDAKLANFCFSPDGQAVAAVDFQYVGGGVGVKDVAYFLGSALDDDGLTARADQLLDRYLDLLRQALARRPRVDVDADALAAEWRALWPLAWADFERFLDGWAPGHWKRSQYAERMTALALARVAPPRR